MNFAGLVYLLIAHYLCGRGVLRLAGIQQSHTASACLSLLIGVPVLSLVPCFIQLLHIPIEVYSVSIGIAVVTFLLSIPLLTGFKPPRFIRPSIPAVYEWPFLFAILLMLALSAWRAFYLPPLSRDMLTGPEMLAEFAVKEKTMISSVFTIDLSTTNNYFKSPYITGLQIVYKILVCPFGQVWLSVLAFSFTGWVYTILRARLHPFLAGFLLFSFMAIPELYAYTYMMLYDYSNMIFFFCGFYFPHAILLKALSATLYFLHYYLAWPLISARKP